MEEKGGKSGSGGGEEEIQCEPAEVSEEATRVRKLVDPKRPSQQEVDEHYLTHLPFRNWCPYCVRGKSVTGAHRRTQKSEEELEREVPVTSVNYMGPKSKEDKSAKIDSLPILVGVDRKSKWV